MKTETRIRAKDYMVHINTESKRSLSFNVYPVVDWRSAQTEEKGFYYQDKEDESDYKDFIEGECLVKMEGSFCWRGVWEGRLYFPDEEYWGEEISELSEVYNEHIIPWCKKYIKEKNPDYYYED